MLARLSLSAKLVISNLLYAVPVVVVLTLLVNGKKEAVNFAKYEMYGNEYERPLMTAVDQVSRHRILAQEVRNGLVAKNADLAALAGQIDTTFAKIATVQTSIGEALQVTDASLAKRGRDNLRPDKILARWSELKSKVATLTPEQSNAAHAVLIGELRALIGHAGDTSNLILDPDLDSYYLMDTTLLAVPQYHDRLQDVRVVTEAALRRGQLAPSDRLQIGVLAALLKADIDRISASTKTSFNEDANFFGISPSLKGNLESRLAAVESSGLKVVDALTKVAAGDEKSVEVVSFEKMTDAALEADTSFFTAAVDELDVLLQVRTASLMRNLYVSVVLGLMALVISGLIAMVIAANLRNEMLTVVSGLQQASLQTRASGRALVETATQLSSSTTEQAAAIQETSASLHEINAMVLRSTENATQSSGLAEKSQAAATKGQATVQLTIEAIGEISISNNDILKQVETSNNQIAEIVQIISEIGEKTKVINEIVFQTKLLSFNASVEAARAGEHGKGFAVVAEEVGGLAQMSGNAAKEISEMLNRSIGRANSIAEETKVKVGKLIETGRERIESGAEVASQCGTLLEELVDQAGNVRNMVQEISRASKEQTQAVGEITKAMGQLDEATELNSISSENTATAAKDLSDQAEDLERIVSRLTRAVYGAGAAPADASQPVAVKKSEKAKAVFTKTEAAKVVPLVAKPAPAAKRPVSAAAFKAAVGSDTKTPSHSDPGFEDL